MSLSHQIAAKPNGVIVNPESGLPALVHRAAQQLASAATAAEVLEARDMASVAYDAAKKAARLAKAKGAHDELIAKAHRAQADALEIEAAAKRRLADEYDAAQDRGEVARIGDNLPNVPDGNSKPTAADIGISRKEIHEARQIRDAEKADPGIVKKTIETQLAEGKEPTKAAVRKAVARAKKPEGDAMQVVESAQQNRNLRTIVKFPADKTPEQVAREGMELEAGGETSREIARMFGIGEASYRILCDIVFLRDRGGYDPNDAEIVDQAFAVANQGRISEAHALISPVAERIWGNDRRPRAERETARRDQFNHAFDVVTHTCATAAEMDIPYLNTAETKAVVTRLNEAKRNLQALVGRLMEKHQ